MSIILNKGHRASALQFAVDERGLSTVEYVIILVLIAAAAVGTWSIFGGTVKGKIQDSNSQISNMAIDSKGANAAPSQGKDPF